MKGAKAMGPNQIVKWGAAIWLFVVLGGIVHAVLHEPKPGFLSGLENFLILMAWQTGAFVVALIVFVVRLVAREQVFGAARWLGIVPFILSGGLALLVTFWILTAP